MRQSSSESISTDRSAAFEQHRIGIEHTRIAEKRFTPPDVD